MAAPILAGDVVKLSVWCSDTEQASVNTYWYGCNSITGTGATDLVFAQEIETSLATLYKPILNNNATFDGVIAQIYRAGQPFIGQESIAHAGAGTGGAISLPRQCSGLISWQTDKAGQKYRGRTYLPFFSASSDVGDGTINAGTVTNMVGLATFLQAGILAGTTPNQSNLFLILAHRFAKGVQPLGDPIIKGLVRPKWATMRKRGSYGRPNVSPI
jgi:hypothetical protein